MYFWATTHGRMLYIQNLIQAGPESLSRLHERMAEKIFIYHCFARASREVCTYGLMEVLESQLMKD